MNTASSLGPPAPTIAFQTMLVTSVLREHQRWVLQELPSSKTETTPAKSSGNLPGLPVFSSLGPLARILYVSPGGVHLQEDRRGGGFPGSYSGNMGTAQGWVPPCKLTAVMRLSTSTHPYTNNDTL